MAPRYPDSHVEASKVLERQMRNWELARAQQMEARPDQPAPTVADFVAVSREVAARGGDVARLLGERLGWPVFDREILHVMAGDDSMRARLYERMDERDVSWLEDTLRWIIRGEFRQEDYFHRLTEAVLVLARQGHAVFLGRGADMILPRDRGLRVRVIAPLERRVEEFAVRNGISAHMARDDVERIDAERAAFRRNHFGPDANDPARYDLYVSLEHFTPPQATEVILAALRARGITR